MTFQAPLGQFLLVTLEPDLHSSRVHGIQANVLTLPGVQSVQDLASVPLEHLAEKVLLRVDPDQWPRGYRNGGGDYEAIRKYWRAKRQPNLL